MTVTTIELEQARGRARRLALKLGKRAHRRLAEVKAGGVREDGRALRDLNTALCFAVRARAITQMLRERGAS